jgi:hypothetical protein
MDEEDVAASAARIRRQRLGQRAVFVHQRLQRFFTAVSRIDVEDDKAGR